MSENSVKAPPLQGKRILVTRTPEQATLFSERLRALGAIPIEFPTIRIVPPQDWGPLDNALRRFCSEAYYHWLVFTSANGVHVFFERLHHLGYDAHAFSNVRIATIGPATAAALVGYGVKADLVPDEYIAESVAAALIENARQRGESLAGKPILLARAAEARKVLVTELQAAGALVDEVAAYRTLAVRSDDERGQEVLHLLQSRQLDILTFTSSSTVRNFIQWLKACETQVAGFSTEVVTTQLKIACIGPITSQTAREFGLRVSIVAKEFTIDGLVEAIMQDEEKS
jgi:uroporphyrinogen-III synthase